VSIARLDCTICETGGAKLKHTEYLKWYYLILLLLLSFNVQGCADAVAGMTKGTLDKIFEPDPPVIKADIFAAKDLNPDLKGQPSSLYFIVYQLRTDAVFKDATFFNLYDGENEDFAKDLISKEEKEIDPGQNIKIEKELHMDSRYIGILAAYRDIDNATWRAIKEVQPDETYELKIDFNRLEVKISEVD
jgi:type VI secretion system protein VasD